MKSIKNLESFKAYEIKEKKLTNSIYGGDTGTTSHITTTAGSSGLDNYKDPSYNDGTSGDWSDRDACR